MPIASTAWLLSQLQTYSLLLPCFAGLRWCASKAASDADSDVDSACIRSDFVVCATGSTDRLNPFGPFNVDYQVCSSAKSHTMYGLGCGLAYSTCCMHAASVLQLK